MSSTALLLLLLDSRSPAGAHNHSSGMEPAITVGQVRDLDGVEAFCRGRLRTAGRVAADFAALAGTAWDADPPNAFTELDAELDARMPSAATRTASRQLGRGLLRLVRSMLPGFDERWDGDITHHAVVLGAAVAAAGGSPALAARAAALSTVSGPASAAVRLLGLDPFAVHGMLARLAQEIDADPFGQPESASSAAADGSPAMDLLAEFHLTAEVRLFAS